MMKTLLAAAVSLSAMTGAAVADESKAKAHLEAIAAAKVDAVMADYDENAVFQWIGGPLDGVYAGPEEIRGVWAKFTKVQGEISVDINDVQSAANPKGVTVSVNALFRGKKPIPVRYVMVYREGELVNEIWQIAAMKSGY